MSTCLNSFLKKKMTNMFCMFQHEVLEELRKHSRHSFEVECKAVDVILPHNI